LQTNNYELLAGGGTPQLLAKAADRFMLEPPSKVMGRVAKQLMTRKKRQELQSLLQDLKNSVEGTSYIFRDDDANVIDAVRGALRVHPTSRGPT
jgi:hypothetical protein